MTAPGAKSGPLLPSDLQAIWEGTADASFVDPLEAAGDGQGLEVYTQLFAQMNRASEAVDTTTQALYILPGSGQSNLPASGAQLATVTLTISRAPASTYTQWALVLTAGQIFVEESTTDWSDQGSVPVLTGRRYVIAQTLVFAPGDVGPHQVQAVAEFSGYGYNNPLPGTISAVSQPGTQYTHDRASLIVSPPGAPVAPGGGNAQAMLLAVNEPDMFLPDHVGQYVQVTTGTNVGKVGRVVGFINPTPPVAGSGVILAFDECVECTGAVGTFIPGEPIQVKSGATLVATGNLLGTQVSPAGRLRIVFTLRTGAFAIGNTVTGINSAATATIAQNLQLLLWTAVSTPSTAPLGTGEIWRVLDWVTDIGLTVTNVEQPGGGTSAMLDELGDAERDIPRSLGESDTAYRKRVATPNDVVSPNAIRRAIARGMTGASWCFREVGSPSLPGIFYDRQDAFDFYDGNVLLFTASGPLQVVSVNVLARGTNYLAQTVAFAPVGTSAQALVGGATNGVVAVKVLAGAAVYTSAPAATVTSLNATGAILQAVLGVPFTPGETLRWVDATGIPVAHGVYGGFLPTATGALLVMVLRPLTGSTRPTLAIQAGDKITGMLSGQVMVPTGVSQPASALASRFHVYLDYTSFRAYFLVGVANLTLGEFGFAYDGPAGALQHVGGFYDATSAVPGFFYDGYPVIARQKWANVYTNVVLAHAGGVGFDLYRETVGCP